MKYLLLILLLLTSCENADVTVKNGPKETTMEVLNNIDTTANVAIVDNVIYVVKDGTVVAKGANRQLTFSGVVFVVVVICCIALVLFLE